MGQTQSVPEYIPPLATSQRNNVVENDDANAKQKDDVKTKKKPPKLEAWRSDHRFSFELISPVSDISNPSQFRHRQTNKTGRTQNEINSSAFKGTRVQTSRTRTSKVCLKEDPDLSLKSKGYNNRNSLLPPPSQFYYQPETEPKRPISSLDQRHHIDETGNKVIPVALSSPQKEKWQSYEKITIWKLNCLVLRAKMIKAKENFTQCWSNSGNEKERDATLIRPQLTATSSKDSDSEPVNDAQNPVEPTRFLQLEQTTFQPVWKEQAVVPDTLKKDETKSQKEAVKATILKKAEPYYLHIEEDFVDRIATQEGISVMMSSKNETFNKKTGFVDTSKLSKIQALFDSDDGRQLDIGFECRNDFQSSSKEGYSSHGGGKVTRSFSQKLPHKNSKGSSSEASIKMTKLIDSTKIHENDSLFKHKNETHSETEIAAVAQERSKLTRPIVVNCSETPFVPNKERRLDAVTEKRSNKTTSTVLSTENHKNKQHHDSTPTTTLIRPSEGEVIINQDIKSKKSSRRSLDQSIANSKRTKGVRRTFPPVGKRRAAPTITFLMQQTYISKSMMDDDSYDGDQGMSRREPNKITKTKDIDYRQIALRYVLSPDRRAKTQSIMQSSPALSVASTESSSSRPMLPEEVMNNAAFLFSPSFVGGDLKKIRSRASSNSSISDSLGLSISTIGSRSRLTSKSKPVFVPVRQSHNIVVNSNKVDRRVRFSDENDVSSSRLSVPSIEHALSDLTDGSESIVTQNEHTKTNLECTSALVLNSISSGSLLLAVEALEDIDDHSNISCIERATTWSYRDVNGSSMGVTPLIGRKGGHHITNSPFLRFQAAKRKFGGSCGGSISMESYTSSRRSTFSPFRKKEGSWGGSISMESYTSSRRSITSPFRKREGSLVNERVASMESLRRPNLMRKSASNAKISSIEGILPKADEESCHQSSYSKMLMHQDMLNYDIPNVNGSLPSNDIHLPSQEPQLQNISQGSEIDLFDEFLNVEDEDNEIHSYTENGSVATIPKGALVGHLAADHQSIASPGDASTICTAVSSVASASVATIQQRRTSTTNGEPYRRKL